MTAGLTLLNCILVAVEYFSVAFVMFDIALKRGKNYFRILAIISLIILEEIGFVLIHYNDFVAIGFAFLCCFVLFEVKGTEILKLFFIVHPCVAILETPFYHLSGLISGGFFQTFIAEASLILLFFGIFLFRKRQRGWISFYDPAWKFLIAILWIMALMMSYFQYILQYVYSDRARVSGNFLFISGSIAMNILLVAMLRYIMTVRKVQMEMEFIEKYNEQQRMYFLNLLNHEQKTRKFRHDINNQIIQLKDYCEKQEYEKLELFLTEMSEQCVSIKGKNFDVGNEIVNVVLNYYLSSLDDTVFVRVKGYMEDETDFTQRDLCILFSNLVKNAVEATERQTEGKKEILIWIKQKDRKLMIHIENTFDQNEISQKKDGTIKADRRNHGFGTQIIDEIVRKYQGNCLRMVKEEKFTTELHFLKK